MAIRVTVATFLALLVAATIAAAHAAPASTSGCAQIAAIKTVFPTARSVGFNARSSVRRVGTRERLPAWCGNWTTTYTGIRGLPSAFTEVTVSLYKTRQGALVALGEPVFGPTRVLPKGVRMRTHVDMSSGDVASVVRNVFISSSGCCGPPPSYAGSGQVRAQIRIHRRIHGAVLALK